MGGQAQPSQLALRRVDRRAASLGLPRRHIRLVGRHQAPAAQRDAQVPERVHRVPHAHARQGGQVAARARHTRPARHTEGARAPRRPARQDPEGARRVLGARACLLSALLLRRRRGPARDHRQLEERRSLAEALQEDVRRRGERAPQRRSDRGDGRGVQGGRAVAVRQAGVARRESQDQRLAHARREGDEAHARLAARQVGERAERGQHIRQQGQLPQVDRTLPGTAGRAQRANMLVRGGRERPQAARTTTTTTATATTTTESIAAHSRPGRGATRAARRLGAARPAGHQQTQARALDHRARAPARRAASTLGAQDQLAQELRLARSDALLFGAHATRQLVRSQAAAAAAAARSHQTAHHSHGQRQVPLRIRVSGERNEYKRNETYYLFTHCFLIDDRASSKTGSSRRRSPTAAT